MITDELIEVINKTVNKTVFEIKNEKLLKNETKTYFQKTESLLYNYVKFKEIIKEREEAVKRNDVVHKKSGDIGFFSKQPSGIIDNEERYNEEVNHFISSTEKTKRSVKIIDEALKKVKRDPYYPIIKFKYFFNKTHEEIAGLLGKDTSTITKNKNRLINEIKMWLFSDEVLEELLK